MHVHKWFWNKHSNLASLGGPFGSQLRTDDNLEWLDNSYQTVTGKRSLFWRHTNQYYLLYGNGCPSSQQPFPGASKFHHHSPYTITHGSQLTTSLTQPFPSQCPQWQESDLHHGGSCGSQRFPSFADCSTTTVISRCTWSDSSTTRMHSRLSVNIFQHFSTGSSF